MTHPTEVHLTVGFDADQTSDQLAFGFESSDGGDPNHPTGLFAGEIHFREGEIFHLAVTGSGRPATFRSFQIVDCCLITRPMIVNAGENRTTRYAVPSPFTQAIGASHALELDFTSSMTHTPELRLVTQHWKRTLDVGNTPGRWDMSLLLTVRIFRGEDRPDDIRVFSFDPETEVGSGRGKDRPRP